MFTFGAQTVGLASPPWSVWETAMNCAEGGEDPFLYAYFAWEFYAENHSEDKRAVCIFWKWRNTSKPFFYASVCINCASFEMFSVLAHILIICSHSVPQIIKLSQGDWTAPLSTCTFSSAAACAGESESVQAIFRWVCKKTSLTSNCNCKAILAYIGHQSLQLSYFLAFYLSR